jgi:hypothetical protein
MEQVKLTKAEEEEKAYFQRMAMLAVCFQQLQEAEDLQQSNPSMINQLALSEAQTKYDEAVQTVRDFSEDT